MSNPFFLSLQTNLFIPVIQLTNKMAYAKDRDHDKIANAFSCFKQQVYRSDLPASLKGRVVNLTDRFQTKLIDRSQNVYHAYNQIHEIVQNCKEIIQNEIEYFVSCYRICKNKIERINPEIRECIQKYSLQDSDVFIKISENL